MKANMKQLAMGVLATGLLAGCGGGGNSGNGSGGGTTAGGGTTVTAPTTDAFTQYVQTYTAGPVDAGLPVDITGVAVVASETASPILVF
jgi:hypothetical protein